MWGTLCLLVFGAFLPILKVEAGIGAARLVCYVESGVNTSFSECTHLVYAGAERDDKLDDILKEYRKNSPGTKILLRVTENDKDLRNVLKSKYIQGLEVYDAHQSLNRTKVSNYVEKAKAIVTAAGGGPLFLSLPAHPELLAKYYDLRTLVKAADLMMVQTHALGLVKKMTYHPSRLSGLWDMMNTDSVVDLVIGLGVPASKLVISLPATALRFTLQNETLSTPGSPAKDDEPLEIDQAELCKQLSVGPWTVERDQDLAAPYAFMNETWISFEDSSSVDVKSKYARIRGLAGLALHQAEKDVNTACGPTLRVTIAKVLNSQSRAPRAAVLRSLEHEILSSSAHHARPLDALQLSPYRITQIVDSDGVIHSIREDTRTEFSCSRQGYFVHPRSCARFYRCVKFDQLSPDYTVFEFDCPAGLAFDSRYEVCVWPGSLQHSQACPGSSEIAPVPQTRFVCPEHEGYYADPENCRWFFACIDHGKAPLAAYEFRCPFGLGFDAARLQCDWPWLVPSCGNIARYEAEAHGFSGAVLTGATGFYGKTADAVNVAAHQSIVSGASQNNLVGIQGGFLSKGQSFDGNYIANQNDANEADPFEYQNSYNAGLINDQNAYPGSQTTNHQSSLGFRIRDSYSDKGHYTSGSLILDEYRLPSNDKVTTASHVYSGGLKQGYADDSLSVVGLGPTNTGANQNSYFDTSVVGLGSSTGGNQNLVYQTSGNNYYNAASNRNSNSKSQHQHSGSYIGNQEDSSGAYVHDPSGDFAEPYRHIDSPIVPYVHDDKGYKSYIEYTDNGRYKESYSRQNGNNGYYVSDNRGQYVFDNRGKYIGNSEYGYENGNDGAYKEDYSGAYRNDYSGSYTSGTGNYKSNADTTYGTYSNGFSSSDSGLSGFKNDKSTGSLNYQQFNAYSKGNNGDYISGGNVYTGASHTLAAGAVNVGLVGKTSLVAAQYNDQVNYQNARTHNTASHSQTINHGVNYQKSQSSSYAPVGVSVFHAGTDVHSQNDNTYSYVTTPTTSGIPTTATPIAVTSSIPVTTYRTTYVPYQPTTNIKQVLGYSQPAVTYVRPTVVAVTAAPKIELNHSQSVSHTYQENKYSTGNSFKQYPSAKVDLGYDYPKPAVKFEDGVKSFISSTPSTQEYIQPSIVKYEPRGFSHNTVHKENTFEYNYEAPTPIFEEPIKKAFAGTPAVSIYSQPTVSTYVPQSYSTSHQTIHKVDSSKVNQYSTFADSGAVGYEYPQPTIKFEEKPQAVLEYTTAQPAIVQSTYKPQSYSHQTVHNIETPKTVPVPSTSVPHAEVKFHTPAVTLYENPFIKYTQEVTPALTYVSSTPVYSQQKTYQPIITQHEVKHILNKDTQQQQTFRPQNIELHQPIYSLNQPEIQTNIEFSSGATYSQPSTITHQVYHQASTRTQEPKSQNNAVFVSTTPANIVHEEHYSEYEAPKQAVTYKAQEYLPPKQSYVEPYAVVTTPTSLVNSQQYSFVNNQKQNDYQSAGYAERSDLPRQTVTPLQQVSFSTQHFTQPKADSSYVSSYSRRPVTSTYKPIVYESPEIQVGYTAEEYLPPVVYPVQNVNIPTVRAQTYSPAVVSTTASRAQTYSPATVSTTRQYISPTPDPKYTGPEYLPPKVDNTYLPPSTTVRPIIKYTTQTPTFRYVTSSTPVYKAPEYVPPSEKIVDEPKIVNFESFGLRNNDALSKIQYNPYDYTGQQSVASPEFSTIAPVQRKQNIIISKSKSNLLGFGTVGPDAGLVSDFSFSTVSPSASPVTQSYTNPITSTVSPTRQDFIDVTPYSTPVRRTKPQVAVVTKINDFNPLLVKKLGAVCSCQSPVLTLKGKRPNAQPDQNYDNYGKDYDESGRGDINTYDSSQNYERIKSIQTVNTPSVKSVTLSPVITSSLNPIIVPDDSYYQDYREPRGKEVYSENFVSSTPISTYTPSTQNIVRIRPRTKTVTAAPTYRTVLLNEEVTPTAIAKASQETLTFDRYGPGGWRSRDETLQGTVDCQRAGLFRHPKQCNKFYACRWDCTKQRFTLHVFNCPVQLSFDPKLGACNWPSQGPACQGDTLLTNSL